MMHLAKTLFLDYKWSSVYNFYKINCSAKTFTVSSQVFQVLNVELLIWPLLRKKTCSHVCFP